MKREVKQLQKQIQQLKERKAPQAPQPHHQGKGTRARLNTAAEKHLFGSKYSQ